jgi:late competence protein required for DNA uptake (superfamily II DNA/RNA helicase)
MKIALDKNFQAVILYKKFEPKCKFCNKEFNNLEKFWVCPCYEYIYCKKCMQPMMKMHDLKPRQELKHPLVVDVKQE